MGKTFSRDTPFPREFDCRKCGDHVKVTDRGGRRTVYCSQYCEVQYWRDKSRDDWRKRIDLVNIDLSETKKGALACNSVSVTIPGGSKVEVGEGWISAETRDGYRFYNEYGLSRKE